MNIDKFHQIVADIPSEIHKEVSLSMDILERINELLDRKFQGKQKLLAEKMNKSEAEISRWFSGVQNFTVKTIAKLEAAFGERIIAVCTDKQHSDYIKVKPSVSHFHASVVINENLSVEDQVIEYEELKASQHRNATLQAN